MASTSTLPATDKAFRAGERCAHDARRNALIVQNGIAWGSDLYAKQYSKPGQGLYFLLQSYFERGYNHGCGLM